MNPSPAVRVMRALLVAATGSLAWSVDRAVARYATPLDRARLAVPLVVLDALGAWLVLAGTASALAAAFARPDEGPPRRFVPGVLPALPAIAALALAATPRHLLLACGLLAVAAVVAAAAGDARRALAWVVVLGTVGGGLALAADEPAQVLWVTVRVPLLGVAAWVLATARAVGRGAFGAPSRPVLPYALLACALGLAARFMGIIPEGDRSAFHAWAPVVAVGAVAAGALACLAALWPLRRTIAGVQQAIVQDGAALVLTRAGAGVVASLPIQWTRYDGRSGTVPAGVPLPTPVPLRAARVVLRPGRALCLGQPALSHGAHRGQGEVLPWVFPGDLAGYAAAHSAAARAGVLLAGASAVLAVVALAMG